MIIHDQLSGEDKKEKLNMIGESFQYNKQDLDQEQKVDVNPMQLNTQNLHIHVKYDNNYTGKITGVTCKEKNMETVKNADIYLFFGNESKLPVYKTNSDNNGNFTIDEIPPGYYTISGRYKPERLYYRSHFIKVLPGQSVHHNVLLNETGQDFIIREEEWW